MNDLIYLDYAATTPIDERVIETMLECMGFRNNFGNPASRTHNYGQCAALAVEQARQQLADLIQADPEDLIWTSGATESNNLALKGIAQQYAGRGKHIITSQIEHKAILDSCHELQQQGFEVTYLKPQTGTGLITADMVRQALRPDTILVSLMMVNNEIGTLTDVAAIAETVKSNGSLLHVDAAQAAAKVDIDLSTMNIDLMSFSGHKIYGPKGIGALFVRQSVELKAQMHGGGHEQGMRSGTLATHQIVGMGAACEWAKHSMQAEQVRLKQLRNKLWQGLQRLGGVQLNGHASAHVANYLNVSFIDEQADAVIAAIQAVAAVSSGSACNSHQAAASHVLTALDVPSDLARQTVRFSLGAYTTEQDIDTVLTAVEQVYQQFIVF